MNPIAPSSYRYTRAALLLSFSATILHTIELRKGRFGASLQAGDSIVIYATLPVGKASRTKKYPSLSKDYLIQGSLGEVDLWC